ncbi:MAG: FlgO family outer membrane protein [Deltaproteobacteria bacterium]
MLLAISVFIPSLAQADFKKTKVAVLDFQLQGEGFETQDMGKIVAEWIITGLVQAGRFDVVERSLLEKILKEQELPMYGIVDSKNAAKTGMIVGAKVVITGSVMKLRQFTEVSARLINVEDGSIIAAEKVKSDSTSKLEDLVSQMVDKIVLDFPLEGYIVQRDDNSVLIDIGRLGGAKVGKKFVVYKEGKVIKHPKTGEVLDIERVEIGEVEITSVKDKTSSANIVSELIPDGISYGSMVRSSAEISAERHTKPTGSSQEARLESVGDFFIGQEYYILTTLHTARNLITWVNRTDLIPMRTGEKVILTALERNYAKIKWNNYEYTFVYHAAKGPDALMLSKFLSKENTAGRMTTLPEAVKSSISQGEVKIGMSKWEVLYSRGVPVIAGDRKTYNMSLDDVLNMDKWIYSEGRMDSYYVDFADGKVIRAED